MNRSTIIAGFSAVALILLTIFMEELNRQFWIFSVILYAVVGITCFFILLNSIMKKSWLRVTLLLVSFLISTLVYLPRTELLKSERILQAWLDDDTSGIRLILRKNSTFEVTPVSWIGELESFQGKYQIIGDQLIFLNKPFDNNFIPDTVHFYQDKIILNGDVENPDLSFANYFEIKLDKLKSR